MRLRTLTIAQKLAIALVATATSLLAGCHLRPVGRQLVEVPIYRAAGDPAMGGRIVAVSVDRQNRNIAIAATHSGGLFRTADAGKSWKHLDGLEPNRLWDVQIDPTNSQTVIATVVVDTHNPGLHGLWLSRDGGNTWSAPMTTSGANCKNGSQPAYGRWISFGPPPHIFVGTDCGLAVSHDHGGSWSLVAPHAGSLGVMGVVSRPGPNFPGNPNSVIVDVCGDAGPFRSIDAGSTFNAGATGLAFPIQFCSMAASPDETHVVFAASKDGPDGILWESDDGGTTWTQLSRISNPGRFPWVRTTRTSSNPAPHFDLFFHAGADVFHISCDSFRSGTRFGTRCPVLAPTSLPRFTSPPHDYGGMAFSADGCPRFMGNDHGALVSSDCGQSWAWVHDGLHALQIYSLAGTVLPDHTDLYFATQDNAIWSSSDDGASWQQVPVEEGLDLQAPHNVPAHGLSIVSGTECAPCFRRFWADHLINKQAWPPASDQNVPNRNGNPPFVVPGSTGVPTFLEFEDINLWIRPPTGMWRQAPLTPPLTQAPASNQIFISGPENDPTVYAIQSRADGTHTLLRINGVNQTAATVTDVGGSLGDVYIWSPDDNPWRSPFVVGVSPQDGRFAMVGDRVRALVLTTNDGGNTWLVDQTLNNLIVDGGKLQFHAAFHGLQVHVIKYNPANSGHILIGTEASGIIESCDNGFSWRRVPGSLSAKAVSDFFFDERDRIVYVSTYGRGLWKMAYPRLPTGGWLWKLLNPGPPTDPCWEGVGRITLATAQLSFSVATNPPGDPAQVIVRLDGNPWAGPVGDGYNSSKRAVTVGSHVVQITLLPQFASSMYDIIFSGACQASGTVSSAQNQVGNCNVLIRRRP